MRFSVADVVPELTLLGGAVVVLLFALFAPRRAQKWAALLALATLTAAAILTVTLLGGGERFAFAGTYAVDGAARWGKLIALIGSGAILALSVDWFADDPRHGEYYALLLLSVLGAVLLAGAADLMQLTLAVLLASSTGAVLIAYHRRSRRAGEAAIKFYLLGALTNGAMMFGVALLFGLAGTTTYQGLAGPLTTDLAARSAVPLVAATALVLVGLSFKLGAVPAHAWLPDVADGAPAPVAAFMIAIPKVGALVAVARLVNVLPEELSGWRPVIALMAALTMTLGNVAALWQDDVRRLLGWSAVSQSGYGLMAVVALGRSALALPALLYFLVAYALATIVAFGVVVQFRGLADRARYAGLAARHPWLTASIAISLLSFIGVPPLAGFVAKLTLFGAVVEAGYGWLAVVAVVNTVVSVAYYVRVLAPAYFEPAVEARQPVLGRWAAIGVAGGTFGLIALGLWAEPLLRAFSQGRLLPL